jgi:hypothetical protein
MFDEKFIEALATALAPKVAALIVERIEVPKVTNRWVDLEQAAVLMSTTKDAVRGMARAKLFPVKKMGGRVMIDIRELEKAFAENTAWLLELEPHGAKANPGYEHFRERLLDMATNVVTPVD